MLSFYRIVQYRTKIPYEEVSVSDKVSMESKRCDTDWARIILLRQCWNSAEAGQSTSKSGGSVAPGTRAPSPAS
jgi:hypothetical protein